MSRRIYIQGDQPLCSRLPLHFVSMPVFHFLVHIEVALCATTLGTDTRLVCNAGTTIGNNGNNFRQSSDIPTGKTSECLFVCLLEFLLCFHCEDMDNVRHGFGNSYAPNLVSRPTRGKVSEDNEMVVVQNDQLNTRVRMFLRVCVHVNVSNNLVLMLTHVVSVFNDDTRPNNDLTTSLWTFNPFTRSELRAHDRTTTCFKVDLLSSKNDRLRT